MSRYCLGSLFLLVFTPAGILRAQQTCTAHCDCPQGQFCYYGKCLTDPKTPVYCCSNPGCPPGRWCFAPDGGKGTCAETKDYTCQTACDCGPAHCCKYDPTVGHKICVKDPADPWFPGGEVIGPPCQQSVDATYCCGDPSCHAGRQAYGANAGQFRCYDQVSAETVSFCSGKPCYGTACNCDPGESCLEVIAPGVPFGKTCFLPRGGACTSNAVAEAVYGVSPGDLLPCCGKGCFPGQKCEAAAQTGGPYAYSRVLAVCGSCGNGTCDAAESPSNCPQDCRCGDGKCDPEELLTCPADCGRCGDGTCQAWETPKTCAPDCKPTCGDGSCDLDEPWTCPQDCSCPDSPYYSGRYAKCGDGYCQSADPLGPENCNNCPQDCGKCSTGPAAAPSLAALTGEYLTFFGGDKGLLDPYYAPDIGRSVVFARGALYVVGQTFAKNLPVTDNSSFAGTEWNAFLAKFDNKGNVLAASYLNTNVGVSGSKHTARDIALDNRANVYVAGSMGVVKLLATGAVGYSKPFGSDGAYGVAADSKGFAYATGSLDLGVVKLSPDGLVVYQTTGLGGVGYDIAVDEEGNAYVAGTMGLVKLGPTGSIVSRNTLGGSIGYGIAIAKRRVHVTGQTYSASLPATAGAFDKSSNGMGDAFVAVLDTSGMILYATYLGGADYDIGRGIAVEENGRVYLTGSTHSADFPTTPNAFDRTGSGFGKMFVAVLIPENPGQAGLFYSTLVGGRTLVAPPHFTPDRAFGIALDDERNVYVTGEVGTFDFPTGGASRSPKFTDGVLVRLAIPSR